jgi:CRISPR/Cas system-associated protein Cas10 (large subunit of type III CRISPR-Cas system)
MKALLIDIASKQQYIFQSNKLKLNIGASYIIGSVVFNDVILNTLTELNENIDLSLLYNLDFNSKNVGIGYIGGGNALLLCTDSFDINKFIEDYSLKLLKEFPNLTPLFGMAANVDYENFHLTKKQLIQSIHRNRNFNFSNTNPFKSGIEDDCFYTDGSASLKRRINIKSFEYISKEAKKKFDYCEIAQNQINNTYSEILGVNFTFSDEIEDISPEAKANYIAVVHIDGNGMGQEFADTKTLNELKTLSEAVNFKLEKSFIRLLEFLISQFDVDETKNICIFKDDSTLTLKKLENGKYVLPFRPIINAGDDITFICHGKLGIYLAEKYINILNDISIGNKKIASCAGVSIYHNKFPFFKIYEIAEELAASAKKEARKSPGSSYIQFFISSNSKSGDLEQITKDVTIVSSPHRMDSGEKSSFKKLKEISSILYNEWPKNKIAELRSSLFNSSAEKAIFKLQAQNRKLAGAENIDQFTYESIELIDFYPKNLLKK